VTSSIAIINQIHKRLEAPYCIAYN